MKPTLSWFCETEPKIFTKEMKPKVQNQTKVGSVGQNQTPNLGSIP